MLKDAVEFEGIKVWSEKKENGEVQGGRRRVEGARNW
jgi:hypothetical protein